MDILVIIFCLIIVWGIKPSKHNHDYLNRDTTTAIKGIFAIIILFSHTRQYLPSPHINNSVQVSCDNIYNFILSLIGQLMVVMFLLYSGYGIVESYKVQGNSYKNGFLKKRVLKTLVHFDIAVLLFLILALVLGHEYSPKQYVLSFTGWESIGNSNWFVFDIIALYLMSYIGLIIVERYKLNLKEYLWIIFVFTFALAILLFFLRRGEFWWCDTILAFPTGMLWSVYKEQLSDYLMDSRKYAITLFFVIIVFAALYIAEYKVSYIISIFTSAVFGILVILITMRLKIGNRVLHWLGINAFAIYILQRIPMILLSEFGINDNHVLFALTVFPLTFIIAWGFTKLTNTIDRKFFS